MSNSTELLHIQSVFSLVEAGSGRSAMTQAMMQSVALTMTLVVAIIGGALTGTFNIIRSKLYTSENDVCRHQILTYKDDPRTERIKIFSNRHRPIT